MMSDPARPEMAKSAIRNLPATYEEAAIAQAATQPASPPLLPNNLFSTILIEAWPVIAKSLAPGGDHLMLVGPVRAFGLGERIPLTLRFRKAGDVKVKVPVLKVGSPGPNGAAPAAAHGAHGKH